MEQHYWLFLNLPLELSLEVLTDAGNKAITSIASLNKAHLDLFNKPNGLYQRLVARICNNNMQGLIKEDFDWYREFRIVSYYYDQILNNSVVDPRDLESLKTAFAIDESVKLLDEETYSGKLLIQQSQLPLYPLPIGDYSTAYYEIELDEYFGEEEIIAEVCVGASLHGAISLPGHGRNSFAYNSWGSMTIESTHSWREERFKSFDIDLGEIVGFGINFKNNSIFFTLNGELIFETNETVFGKPLLNLKALHAHFSVELIKKENDAEEMRRVTPIVNFGDDEFAFDLVKYQQSHSANQTNSPQKHRFYSDVIADHVLAYPDYETIKVYEEDPERINQLIVTPVDFPSNVKTEGKAGAHGLDNFLYGLLFLRSAYHDLADGERMEDEFDKLKQNIGVHSMVYECDKGKDYYSNSLIREFGFGDLIAKEGHDEFFQPRYRKFAWEICDDLLSLIRGHCWTIVWGAFIGQNEWSVAVLCYRVYTWQYLMSEENKEMDPEVAEAAKKLLSKILRIEEPQTTPEFIEFDVAFCQYCLSTLRWLAIKTLIQERSVVTRRQTAKKLSNLKKLFGPSDPIIKRCLATMRLLAPPKTSTDDNYDAPLQRLAMRFFSSKRKRDNDDEKMDVSKIDFGSEEELLKARIFDFITKEKIFGTLENAEDDSASGSGSDSEIELE